jgi:NAD(P)-dependent dehydrogenase (short-subunit alcohol dehydrogenase family)
MVDTAVSKFGGLDILVNNAGTSYKNKPTLDVTEAEFDRVMLVNVKSIYHSVGVAIPAMRQRGGGSIINIASIGAMRPRPGLVWYNASKGAVANVRATRTVAPGEVLKLYRQQKASRQNMAKTRSA